MVELSKSSEYNVVIIVVDSVKISSLYSDIYYCYGRRNSIAFLVQYLETIWSFLMMILDRGSQFVAFFTQKLYRLLGIKVATSKV